MGPSTDSRKRCGVITSEGWDRANCEDKLTTFVCLGRGKLNIIIKIKLIIKN
jgi:hypothetical protein